MALTGEKRCVIIGLSGVTCGGKTSLCKELKKLWGSRLTLIHMDDYFRDEGSPELEIIPELQHANWEALEAINFDAMYKDVQAWIQNTSDAKVTPVLLIEGIIVFNYKPLLPLFDRKIFVTLDYEECWERRQKRSYIPADPEGYFDAVVWPMYLKNKTELKDIKDMVYLDGTDSEEHNFTTVLNNIKGLL